MKKREELLKKAYEKLLEVGFADGPIGEIHTFIDDDVTFVVIKVK